MTKFFYRTLNDLNTLIKDNQARLQSYNFDLIVGLPRRGMIPATLIGLFLNKPVVSFNELVADLASEKIGYRLREESAKSPKSYQNILLIDDSTNEGSAFQAAKEKLDEDTWNKITTMSIYSTKKGTNSVDLALEVLESPKIFEWNIMHKRVVLAVSSMRFEGIIASNAITGQWELITAPSYPIKVIVSELREKNRAEVEEFLETNHIQYEHLIMEVVSSKQLKEIAQEYDVKLHYETDPTIARDMLDTTSVYNPISNQLVNTIEQEVIDFDTTDNSELSKM
ncbi:MAG: phosphoribosyltransferase [Lactobacillaceae bacterium]|nr:phosphoribosyltransferase [Lactobacillaceae bacterium]